jgi:hypothetical protein
MTTVIMIVCEKPSHLEKGKCAVIIHRSQSYSTLHVKKTLGALLWLSMLRHLWFTSVTEQRLSTYGFESIDMWLTSVFLDNAAWISFSAMSSWAHAPRWQDILYECSTMTMSGLSRDYSLCFIYHELPFAININLVCAMRHPAGYSSVLLTFHYGEMFWPCLSTDTYTKHGYTPTFLMSS